MTAYKVATVVRADGSLILPHLPFAAGEQVEVTVVPVPAASAAEGHPLRGTVLRYDGPTEPVAADEWEAGS